MSNLPKIENGVIVESGSSIKDWLIEAAKTVWDFIDHVGYWICAIGGVFYLIVFIVTRDGRFKTRALLCVLAYLLICIVGSVI